MKVICINDSNKPADFPKSKWIKKEQPYTIIKVDKLNMDKGRLGVQLEEIDTTGPDCMPYNYFAIERFRPALPTDGEELTNDELIELLQEKEEYA